jgi:hypothetical protein
MIFLSINKQMWFRSRLFVLSIFTLSLILVPTFVLANEITIRPFLIDETLTPRGVSQSTVTIKSDYPYRKAVLYATVNEISVDATGEIKEFVSPVMTDRTDTVTSWIEITRGRIEILPGETKEIPLTVRVHPYAKPGEYHAFIGFVEAANRPKAEAIALAGEAKGVILKIVIGDEREDSMKIASFKVDRFVTGDDSRQIDIEIENTGDLPSAPTGEIIFYDSRGNEITSVPVNETSETIEPGKKVTLKSFVPLDNDLGRYKANVNLKYGEDQKASLYDTTYFYLMPSHVLILVFGVILVISILIALLVRRMFTSHETEDDCQDVALYVREGHEPQPKDHDIDLKKNS